MQTSDVRKFEKIGPEKGTAMFLVKVTKYQIASSSTREVRERKEDRKEGRAGKFLQTFDLATGPTRNLQF